MGSSYIWHLQLWIETEEGVLIQAHLQSFWRLMITERKRGSKQSNDFGRSIIP